MSFTVETDVPYGNACQVEVRAEGDAVVVEFAPHPHGGPETLWFCFRVRRTGPGCGRIGLRLGNPGNMLGGHKVETMRPVVRYDGGDWERLDPGTREELPDGRVAGTWDVRAPVTFLDLAYCYPYGMPELEALVEDSGGALRADTVGASQAGRPILRVSNGPGEPGSAQPGLYLISRQHSSETPGGWVLDGFLRGIAEKMIDEAEAVPLVWAVPLSNIDGVEQGDYGKDNFPYDLNRAWGSPPMRHETLVIQRDMNLWKGRCCPAVALDFHAPGACETSGIYAYLANPKESPHQHVVDSRWAAVFAEALGEYAAEDFGRVAEYPSRWETPTFTRYARAAFGVMAMTLETPYASCGETVMTRERYREAGSRLARAVADRLAGSGGKRGP